MTDGDRIHEMSRVVGGLEATIKNLTQNWQHQDNEATEGRRRLHAKFDALMATVQGLSFRVDGITAELAQMRPTVALTDQERHQAIGSKKVIAMIWSGIIAFIGGTAAIIVELIHQLWGKH
jgi:hypothetical protein